MARLLSLLLGLALFAVPRAARAQEVRCDAPRILIVLDKSSSMLGPVPSGDTKWDAARAAVESVTRAFEDTIDFGLMIFPEPDECHPGAVFVDPAPGTSGAIVDALGPPPPDGGNYTPMAQSLDAAGRVPELADAARRNYVLLLTDGWQWCDPYDPDTRFTPVDAVRALHDDREITTFVVGFGDAVDFLTLSRAAVAGGSPAPGCDVDADEIGEDGCHYQAEDVGDLTDALEAIARTVSEEVCDGTDNDCDGDVDEEFDLDRDGTTTCGSGGGRIDCDDRQADVFPGREESCDGIDNDCDGVIDAGCDCQPGDARACGVCDTGEQICDRGAWGMCEAVQAAPEEACNGADDDCDGDVDEAVRCPEEGFACVEGACVDLSEPPADAAPATPPAGDAHVNGGCACRAGAAVGANGGAWSWLVLALAIAIPARSRCTRRA
jgi:hypothetical protein